MGVPKALSVGLLAATTCIAGSIAVPRQAVSAPVATSSRIVFSSDRDGDYEIYVMDADGSNIQQLTNNHVDDREPAWSPDAKRIAFTRIGRGSSSIFVMKNDGSSQRKVFPSRGYWFLGDPDWSPDGKLISFFAEFSGSQIYAGRPDGSRLREVSGSTMDSIDYDPAWGPSGNQLVFHSNRDESPEEDSPLEFDLFSVGLSFHTTQLTNTDDATELKPAWSPDGRTIVFSRVLHPELTDDVEEDVPHTVDLYTLSLRDNTERSLLGAQDIQLDAYAGGWSPRGDQIVFYGRPVGGDREIYVVNADGTGLLQLTENDSEDWEPDWSS